MDMTTGNPISEDISPIADRAKDPAAFVLGRKVANKRSGATIPERRKENVRKGPNARRK